MKDSPIKYLDEKVQAPLTYIDEEIRPGLLVIESDILHDHVWLFTFFSASSLASGNLL